MTTVQPDAKDRTKAAIAAVALQAVLGYALITGLGVRLPGAAADGLKLFEVASPLPSPPVESIIPERVRSQRLEGAASPANLMSKATEVVAPVPIIPPPVPSPVIVAVIAGTGQETSTGASDVPGPGTGSGGRGSGTGSGGAGDGDGGGGEDDIPPRWLKGRIRDSDYPRAAAEAGIGGTVSVRYTVEANGRVTDCAPTRSSGSSELDALTCRLIEQRFRFRPSRDANERAVPSTIVEDHEWILEADDAPKSSPPSSR